MNECLKCLNLQPAGPSQPPCRLCKGSGICHHCNGVGGWTVELEVMRTEKRKAMIDGLERVQEVLVTVMIPENKPCPACGSHTTPTLELSATSSATYGNAPRYRHVVEASTHLGSSPVQRDYLGNVTEDLRKEPWKGSGKCRHCHGTGLEPTREAGPPVFPGSQLSRSRTGLRAYGSLQ